MLQNCKELYVCVWGGAGGSGEHFPLLLPCNARPKLKNET